jgi:hypothetical protein
MGANNQNKGQGLMNKLPIVLFAVLVIIGLATAQASPAPTDSPSQTTGGDTGPGDQEGAFAPPPGQQVPYYFSGTNCKAAGQVVAIQNPWNWFPEHMVLAELKLNGEVVDSYFYDPMQPIPMIVNLDVRFDSSHFPYGTVLNVELTGIDNIGTQYYDNYQAVVKNRVVALNQPSITTYVPPLSNAALGFWSYPYLSNYGSIYHDNYAWIDAEQFSFQSGSNVLIIGAHGNSSPSHTTGFHDGGSGGMAWVLPPEAEVAQQQNIGTGLPPNNSSQNPPLNLVYLVGCNLATSDQFTAYCWPYQHQTGGSMENQCFVGFNKWVLLRSYTAFAEFMKGAMRIGFSVHMARQLMSQEVINGSDQFEVSDTGIEGDSRSFTASDMEIYGDEYTRIKNVYQQNHARSETWKL